MNSGCSALTQVGSQVVGLALDDVVPPLVARRLHRAPRCRCACRRRRCCTASQPPMAKASSTAGLSGISLPPRILPVGGDDRDGAGVDDALLQALGGEAAEHHRVGRADARAGLHRDHRLDRHRHVDEDAVALLDAERLQRRWRTGRRGGRAPCR